MSTYLTQLISAKREIAVLKSDLATLIADRQQLERRLTGERLERQQTQSLAAGQPTINIWLGPDGRPRCEAPSKNGARRQLPEIVTGEQTSILLDYTEWLRDRAADRATTRNREVWNNTATKHGRNVADRTIGRYQRGSAHVIQQQASRGQKAWDAYRHEEGILLRQAEEMRLAKQPVPSSEQITFWVKNTLRRYGFTAEEITSAQGVKRPQSELSKPTRKVAMTTAQILAGL